MFVEMELTVDSVPEQALLQIGKSLSDPQPTFSRVRALSGQVILRRHQSFWNTLVMALSCRIPPPPGKVASQLKQRPWEAQILGAVSEIKIRVVLACSGSFGVYVCDVL